MKCMLEMFVLLLPSQIGANGKTKENLRESIEYYIGGKCTVEGYVKPNSVQLVKYTNGTAKLDKIEFLVVFECLVCNPVEGMWLNGCKVKSVTKNDILTERNKSIEKIGFEKKSSYLPVVKVLSISIIEICVLKLVKIITIIGAAIAKITKINAGLKRVYALA